MRTLTFAQRLILSIAKAKKSEKESFQDHLEDDDYSDYYDDSDYNDYTESYNDEP